MKKILTLSAILLISIFTFANSNYVSQENSVYPSIAHSIGNYRDIDDGWYTATVKYFNSSTYTNSTYTLNVQVKYDRVTAIDFGNGGSVHSGYNNSDYVYSGGTLYMDTDYNGNITGASTTVNIIYNSGRSVRYSISL